MGVTLLGTTDTDVARACDARVRACDVRYLLETARWWFPRAPIDEAAVRAATVAVRALAADGHGARAASAVSREHAIVADDGVVSLIGGKLTGARAIAEEVVDRVAGFLTAQGTPVRRGGGRTASVPLVDRASGAWTGDDDRLGALVAEGALSGETAARLLARWGNDARGLVTLLSARPEWRSPLLPSGDLLGAEVAMMAEREWAMSVTDVLARRTRALLTDARNGLEASGGVARILGVAWGWDAARAAREVEEYEAVVREMHAWRSEES
jgi:glycerol-3-phosphate dehydrogenase